MAKRGKRQKKGQGGSAKKPLAAFAGGSPAELLGEAPFCRRAVYGCACAAHGCVCLLDGGFCHRGGGFARSRGASLCVGGVSRAARRL